MKSIDIVRTWKDARYRRGLSPQEQANLPDEMALTEKELSKVMGGDGGRHHEGGRFHERFHERFHDRDDFRHDRDRFCRRCW